MARSVGRASEGPGAALLVAGRARKASEDPVEVAGGDGGGWWVVGGGGVCDGLSRWDAMLALLAEGQIVSR